MSTNYKKETINKKHYLITLSLISGNNISRTCIKECLDLNHIFGMYLFESYLNQKSIAVPVF